MNRRSFFRNLVGSFSVLVAVYATQVSKVQSISYLGDVRKLEDLNRECERLRVQFQAALDSNGKWIQIETKSVDESIGVVVFHDHA